MIRTISPEFAHKIRSSTTGRVDEVAGTVWDACIVGSGPGGAVAAATLAEAGWRVLLIERGAFRTADQLNFRVLEMPMRLGRLDVTKGARVALHQGDVLGGGSVLWGAVGMVPPTFVFDEWARVTGVTSINAGSLEPHYRKVASIMSLTRQKPAQENRSNAIVREMAAVLGCPEGLELIQRYTQGCRGTGLCNLGCGFDLKGTMVNSFLPIALETGNLTVQTECEATELEGQPRHSGFRATALHTVLRNASTGRVVSPLAIKAKWFVIASGAIHSSALLLRTRALARRPVGRNVWLQPHAAIHALFDEPVTISLISAAGTYPPVNGVPAIYSFTGMLRDRGYCWFASVLHPASLATATAHLRPEEHLALMHRFHNTSSITVTVRDDPERSQIVMRGGKPRLDYLESAPDRETLRRCFLDASRALLGAGARSVFLPMLWPPRIECESDLSALAHIDLSYDRVFVYSDHMGGGNAFNADPSSGVTDADGRVFGSENVYVADSSLLPSSCGVSPSWTIMALSRLVASRLADGGRKLGSSRGSGFVRVS